MGLRLGRLNPLDTTTLKEEVRTRLLAAGTAELERLDPPERRLRVREEVVAALRRSRAILPAGEVTEVVNQVSDEVVGLGPIERLLRGPEVNEGLLTKGVPG